MSRLSIASYGNIKFAQGKAEGKAEGRAEGKAEGRAEGETKALKKAADLLLKLLKARFNVVPDSLSEAVSLAQSKKDEALLDKWLLKLFEIKDPKEYEEMMKKDLQSLP